MQPLGGTVFVGRSYTLSVTATGAPDLVYQWRKDGFYLDAFEPSLSLSDIQFENSGAYDVVVTNALGSASSAGANLNVRYPLPVITTQPIGNGTLSGGAVTLTADVVGGGSLSYQWYKDGLPLPNATDLSLALGEMKPWLIGDYVLKASNETGTVASNVATLGLAGENPAIWKGLEAYYLMSGNARDTSPFQIHGTVKTGAAFGPDRKVNTGSLSAMPDFSFISAGTFQMGDAADNDKIGNAPVHSVYVSSFFIGQTDVTFQHWRAVRLWAEAHGYTFQNLGDGAGEDHPVQATNWYDVVKWCNAKSEMEGKEPTYYTTIEQGIEDVFRAGQIDLSNAMVKWDANGYRLATEAEWEKAARGGLVGKRFPNGDVLTSAEANFNWNNTQTTPVKQYPPTFWLVRHGWQSLAVVLGLVFGLRYRIVV